MKKTNYPLIALLVGLAACENTRSQVTQKDAQGNYITTSEYQSQDRAKFETAMREGLADFDQRVDQLRKRANELGGDSLSEFAECSDELQEKRVTFVNELERTKAVLADDWPSQREATLEAFYDMREALADAFDDVLDS